MSLVNALQNGTKKSIASNANVNINLGNGNSVIKVTAKNANIDTGCGDQDITAIVSNDLSIDTGFCGEDKINAVVGGNASITTREDNDYINLYVNGNFNVSSGMNHPSCGAEEDNDTVLIHGNLDKTDGKNYVSTGEGTDNVRIIANNVDVNKGDGNLVLGFYGDNYNVNSDADNNIIGFWGDNVNMNINGQGQQDVKTLDFSFEEGRFLDFGFQDLLEQETYAGTTVEVDIKERLTGNNNIDDVAKQYNLTDKQTEQLKSLDLTKTTSNGQSYYLIYNDGKSNQIGYRDNAGNVYSLDGKKQTYSSSSTSSYTYTDYNKHRKKGSRYQHHRVTTTTTSGKTYGQTGVIDIEREKEITKTTTTTDFYNIDGVKNVNINFNDNGKYNVGITSSDGYVNINGQDACNNDIFQNVTVRSGYVLKDTNVDVDIYNVIEKLGLGTGKLSSYSYSSASDIIYAQNSPLVLDTNKDGKVSAEAGKGVDINNDGKADGAATNGDKMLAMSDLNGNGKIDGAEVFGDQTVSPFSGKKINASNGFEALKEIAKEAELYTGINAIKDGKVDVKALAKALEKVGVELGLICDDNTTKLESLGDVKEINVDNYKEANATGDVQHRHLGSYTSVDGKEYKVDDVWFTV